MQALALILLIISAFFYGSQFIAKKFSKLSELVYLAVMSTGILLNALVWSGVIFFQGAKLSYSFNSLVPCFIAGSIFALAQMLLIYAVTSIGMARPFVILNFTSVVSFFGGIIFLGEYAGLSALIQGFLAVLIIIAGCIVITMTVEKDRGHSITGKLGIVAAFGASIFLGVFNILTGHSIHVLKLNAVLGVLVVSFTCLLTCFAIILVTRNFPNYLNASSRDQALGITQGIVWCLATILMFYAFRICSISLAIPILLGLITFFSACHGIVWFKEVERRGIPKFILGALLTFVGIVLITQPPFW